MILMKSIIAFLVCMGFFVSVTPVNADEYLVNKAFEKLTDSWKKIWTIEWWKNLESKISLFFHENQKNKSLLLKLKKRLEILSAQTEGKSDSYILVLDTIVAYNDFHLATHTHPSRTQRNIVDNLSDELKIEQDNIDTYITMNWKVLDTYFYHEPYFDPDWSKPWNQGRLDMVKQSFSIKWVYGKYIIVRQQQWGWSELYIIDTELEEVVFRDILHGMIIDAQVWENDLYVLVSKERWSMPALIQVRGKSHYALFDTPKGKYYAYTWMELLSEKKVKLFYTEDWKEKTEIVNAK